MFSATHNCPQCGSALPQQFRYSKLAVCAHCHSTIFLEDQAVRLAGKASVLAEMPSLLQLQLPFRYQEKTYTPVGQVRYRYQGGYWDEWWVIDSAGRGHWVSVDEGDFAFEILMEWQAPFPDIRTLQVGQTLVQQSVTWHITEKQLCQCEGVAGELPEPILPGERMGYVHLSGEHGALITLEYPFQGEACAYRGQWVDPFEIQVMA